MHQGKKLSIGDNERKRGRAMSKIKRALMEQDGDRTDITIDGKGGNVYVGRAQVAKWDGEGLRLAREAELLKERIDELMTERVERDGRSD